MNGRPAKIFVVDDDVSVCVALSRLMRAAGLHVETFGTAADLLTADRLKDADCLVLDVQLPDATGFDVCEFLCGEHPLPEIVLVSSRDASDYNGLIQTSHARGFISKADLSGEALRVLLA